ncbi:hypothetical protein ACHAWF_007451 [Thalassiosira exigua]
MESRGVSHHASASKGTLGTPSPTGHSRCALIFSSALVRNLENNPAIRLPSTYVGVRRVRPSGTGKRKHHPTDDDGDDWTPTAIGDDSCSKLGQGVPESKAMSPKDAVYKVTNPDGSQRRMTTQEKRQLKYQIKRAKHSARKEERRAEHEKRINKSKLEGRERRRRKWLARKYGGQAEQGHSQSPGQEKDSAVGTNGVTSDVKENDLDHKNDHEQLMCEIFPENAGYEDVDEELAALQGKRRGIPPVMLTPAATCLAQDIGLFQRPSGELCSITTTMDSDLSAQWASRLAQSMTPAEALRAKEDMRPMAYRLVPEVWKRLCPTSLWDGCAERKGDMHLDEAAHKAESNDPETAQRQQEHSLAILRDPSQPFDADAYAVFRHLHQHSNLHVACGALFGCDFLLYDGRREDRHSFAGLRVYSCRRGGNVDPCEVFPTPTAYDLTGFVRTMNTARKLALVATVVRDSNTARVAVVDLALEKVLTAYTHIRKGNTTKRRSEEDAASGLAKKD